MKFIIAVGLLLRTLWRSYAPVHPTSKGQPVDFAMLLEAMKASGEIEPAQYADASAHTPRKIHVTTPEFQDALDDMLPSGAVVEDGLEMGG